jgi:hypothetical protein
MYIEELQQQWESLEVVGQLPQDLLRELLQQLTDGLPFERSVGYLACIVIAENWFGYDCWRWSTA